MTNHHTQSEAPRTVTLPDSGAVLELKFIGPMLARDIQKQVRRALPKPQPPVQMVPDGDGHERAESNDADPDYKEAVQEWTRDQGQAFVEALVHYGVHIDLDELRLHEDEVTELRKQYLALPSSDMVVYVTRILLRTSRDMLALQSAILGEFQTT